MPIYEYTCESCSAKFDKLMRTMSSSETPVCPKCGSKKTQRAMSVFAVSSEAPSRGGAAHGPGCGCCSQNNSCPMAE